jgi:flagellar motor switch/type III secretory pathway protein FliN
VSGVGPGTLSLAFSVNIPAGGSTTVEFDLKPAVTSQVTAQVKVDPGNAIKEANKDNNTQSFGLTPAVEQPNLVISRVDLGDTINVKVTNTGGPLPVSTLTVKVTVAGIGIERSTTIALAKGQDSTFTLNKPASGAGKVEVFINGQLVASQNVTVP